MGCVQERLCLGTGVGRYSVNCGDEIREERDKIVVTWIKGQPSVCCAFCVQPSTDQCRLAVPGRCAHECQLLTQPTIQVLQQAWTCNPITTDQRRLELGSDQRGQFVSSFTHLHNPSERSTRSPQPDNEVSAWIVAGNCHELHSEKPPEYSNRKRQKRQISTFRPGGVTKKPAKIGGLIDVDTFWAQRRGRESVAHVHKVYDISFQASTQKNDTAPINNEQCVLKFRLHHQAMVTHLRRRLLADRRDLR